MKNLLVALSMAAAAILTPLAPTAAQDKITITSSSDSLAYIPVYAAEAMGYFKQSGIEMSRVLTNSGARAIAALISGDVDMVMGAAPNPLNARKAGGDVVMIAALSAQYGVNIVMSKKWVESHKLSGASPYKDKLAGLKGARIGVTGVGGGADQLVRFLAEEAGINPDRELELVTIPESSTMLAAMSQDRIDALAQSAPTSHVAVRDFGGVMMLNTVAGDVKSLDGFLGSSITVSGDWMRKHEALAVRFSRALQMSFDTLHDPVKTVQARDAVHKLLFAQLDRAMFADMWAELVTGLPKTPALNRKMIETLIDFGNKFTREKMDYSVIDAAYTNAYLDKARQ